MQTNQVDIVKGYRPLSALLFRLEWSLGYGTPLIAHLTSVLLHGISTFLFFRLALSLAAGPMLALVTSLLFAAHPVHVEAVAYISGRPDLLATTLALTALLIARRADLCTPEGCRSLKIWPAYVAYAAALLSDEVALAMPFILVGLDRWGPNRVPFQRRRTHYSGFLAITLVYLLVRFTSGHGFLSNAGAAASGIEPGAHVWAAPMAIYESLRVLFVPHPLNALRTLTVAEVASVASRIAPFLRFWAWRSSWRGAAAIRSRGRGRSSFSFRSSRRFRSHRSWGPTPRSARSTSRPWALACSSDRSMRPCARHCRARARCSRSSRS